MNYNRINNLNQRQFDIVMKRECITVTDYFYRDVTYDIFCRRNNRGTNPQGKIRIFYAKTTPISIGTMFILNGECFLVNSQDNIESDVYWTSMATKCDNYFNVMWKNDGNYVSVPCVTISDKYTLDKGSVLNLISGSVNIITGLNQYSKGIEIDDVFWAYGGRYKVGNYFYNDGLAYIFMTREAKTDNSGFDITYTGNTVLYTSTGTYQLTYKTIDENNFVVENPKLSYLSNNPSIATVDKNGLLTIVSDGSVVITTTWMDGGLKECETLITIKKSDDTPTTPTDPVDPDPPVDPVTPTMTAEIYASTDTIKVGGSYKSISMKFYDTDGIDVTTDTIANLTADDFDWTYTIDGVDYETNTDVLTILAGTTVNATKVKFANDRSYLTKILVVGCTCATLGLSATKEFTIAS